MDKFKPGDRVKDVYPGNANVLGTILIGQMKVTTEGFPNEERYIIEFDKLYNVGFFAVPYLISSKVRMIRTKWLEPEDCAPSTITVDGVEYVRKNG